VSVLNSQTVRRSSNRKLRRKAPVGNTRQQDRKPAQAKRARPERLSPPLARSQPSDSFRQARGPSGQRLGEYTEAAIELLVDGGRHLLKSTGWFGATLSSATRRVVGVAAVVTVAGATLVWRTGLRIAAGLHRAAAVLSPRVRWGVRTSAQLGMHGAVTSARAGRRVAVRTRVGLRNQAEDMRDGFPDLQEGVAAGRRAWIRFLGGVTQGIHRQRKGGFLARPSFRDVGHAAAKGLVIGGTWAAVAAGAMFGPQAVRESQMLNLTEMDVRGNERVERQVLLAASGVELGDNLVMVDLETAADEIQKLEWVETVSLRRAYPDRLAISVKEREPVSLLADGQLWFVDGNAEVFKPVSAGEWQDLPVVSGVTVDDRGVDPVGSRDRLRRALDVVNAVGASQHLAQIDIGELRVLDSGGFEVLLADSGATLHLDEESYEMGLQRLDTLLDRELVALDDVSRLDLALRNQVVATWRAEL